MAHFIAMNNDMEDEFDLDMPPPGPPPLVRTQGYTGAHQNLLQISAQPRFVIVVVSAPPAAAQ